MVAGPIQIHPNEDIKVFNKHLLSDPHDTVLLSATTIVAKFGFCFRNLRYLLKPMNEQLPDWPCPKERYADPPAVA